MPDQDASNGTTRRDARRRALALALSALAATLLAASVVGPWHAPLAPTLSEQASDPSETGSGGATPDPFAGVVDEPPAGAAGAASGEGQESPRLGLLGQVLMGVAALLSAGAAFGFWRDRERMGPSLAVWAFTITAVVLVTTLRTFFVGTTQAPPATWGFWLALAAALALLGAYLTRPTTSLFRYMVRRLILSVPVLLGVTLLTFGISWQANEGHMERAYLSDKMTLEQRERIIENYGFDQPWYVQYFSYLQRVVTLDLGFSRVESDRPVLEVYKDFLPATLELTLAAMLVAVFAGVALGSLTAVRKDSPVDHATRFIALSGVSVPIFWLGLLLKFAFSTNYPAEMLTEAGPIGKTVFFSVAFGIPLAAGAFAADALDPRSLTWGRLAAHLAVWALLLLGLLWVGWTFAALVLGMVVGTAYAIAATLHALRARRLSPWVWRGLVGGVVLVSAGLALSPMATGLVVDVFDLVPDFPLGGRASSHLMANVGEHPTLVKECLGTWPEWMRANMEHGCTGLLVVDTALARDWVAFGDVLHHLVLPAVTLGYASLAVIARMMRSSMLEVLPLDYVRTARAKGLPEAQVIRRHARRNALIPIATVVGLTFGSLLSGAVLTETIFQWSGLGRWSTKAIVSFDTTSVMSFTLLVVVIYLIANFVVDFMYSVLDPRVRL